MLYVDDILLCCDGSRGDATELKEVLDLYCFSIVMMVNIRKSTISLARVKEEEDRYFTELFMYQQLDLQHG